MNDTQPTPTLGGIHHVTAIASDPQTNLDFYSGLLGLRLVKRTVNFDDPGTYHLYYGDETGRPGTILTFFPWPLARRGQRGTGQATAVALSVPEGSLGWWSRRLTAAGVPHDEPVRRFGGEVLVASDPDGLRIELAGDPAAADIPPWSDGPVADRYAVRGVQAVTLTVARRQPTVELLTRTMGFRPEGEEGRRLRLATASAELGAQVDLLAAGTPELGRIAAGSIHHVAWRVPDDDTQSQWRQTLLAGGLHPTEMLDRRYFRSIYFREPGGVLYELATDTPGFAADEAPADLGGALQLPPWLEARRGTIERNLPPLAAPAAFEPPMGGDA